MTLPFRRPKRTGPALLVVALTSVGATAGCGDEVAPTTHSIEIQALTFEPTTIHARIGDTITWTNRDVVPHTVTAETAGWESGELLTGATFTLVLETAADVAYLCRFHPMMTASVAVAENGRS